MNGPKLEDKISELIKEFEAGASPQHRKIAKLAKQSHDNHRKLQKRIDSLQESLDYLRMYIKYQLFDLEATRRENKYLRNMLDRKNS